ncbi:LVIVD repeat-containing protein [Limnobacter sp.]|uniref:LVIVD repeat-containing protein n=1 Tax=Limnobacter sp. TaxID=2003368 RepID=UPI003511BCF6
MVSVSIVLGGCFGGDSAPSSSASRGTPTQPSEQPPAVVQTSIPRAQCRPGDQPETALQGQVPLAQRLAGFAGTHCNMDLVGQYEGEGTSWMHTSYKHCSYYGQAFAATAVTSPSVPRASLRRPGTVVMDVSNSAQPKDVGRLTSISMLDPWESLKVNVKRGLLAAVNGTSSGGGPEFDVYSIAADCTQPQLLYSGPLADDTVIGHEGEWAPDGLTYYGGDLNQGQYYAIDVSNPSAPAFITKFTPPVGVHGLSVSPDGTRGYVTLSGTARNEGNNTNGFAIYDFTPIAKRLPDPTPRLLAEVYWADGSVAQHTIPVKIGGRDHLITVDELGSDGVNAAASRIVTCGTDRLPFGIPRIFDVSDVNNIKLLSKLTLEINQPENCPEASQDTAGLALFGYDSHYCQVDNPEDAKVLACGYFNSGLRVFDISKPNAVREIAYFNPAMRPGQKGGSTFNVTGNCFGADWTSSQPRFVLDKNEIWFTSQCAGFQVVKIDPAVWPR